MINHSSTPLWPRTINRLLERPTLPLIPDDELCRIDAQGGQQRRHRGNKALMETRPCDPASARAGAQEAAAAAVRDFIIGHTNIARALGRSPRKVTRWFRAGAFPAGKIDAAANNTMIAPPADLDWLAAPADERSGS